MPNRTESIELFDKGVVTVADSQDIPKEASVYSFNQDPFTTEGMLKPLKTWLQNNALGTLGNRFSAMIDKSETEKTLIYSAPPQLNVIEDYEGNPSLSSLTNLDTSGKIALTAKNKGVFIGQGSNTPKWVGYTGKQFGTAYGSIYTADAVLTSAVEEYTNDIALIDTDNSSISCNDPAKTGWLTVSMLPRSTTQNPSYPPPANYPYTVDVMAENPDLGFEPYQKVRWRLNGGNWIDYGAYAPFVAGATYPTVDDVLIHINGSISANDSTPVWTITVDNTFSATQLNQQDNDKTFSY